MLTPAKIDFSSGTPDPSASLETYSPTEAESIVKKIPSPIQIK